MKLVRMLRSIRNLVGDAEYKLLDQEADELVADSSAIVLRVEKDPVPTVITENPKEASPQFDPVGMAAKTVTVEKPKATPVAPQKEPKKKEEL